MITISRPFDSVSIALANKAAFPAPATSKAATKSADVAENVSVKETLSSIAIKYPSIAILIFASGRVAVNPILALADSSCLSCGIPNSFATLLSLEKVPTSCGFPKLSN